MSYWKSGKKKNSALKRDTDRHRNQKAAYRNVQQQMRSEFQKIFKASQNYRGEIKCKE